MKLLSLLFVIILLISCEDSNNMVLIRTVNKNYCVDKTTIVHLSDGCISFKRCGHDSKITVCGSYTIEE